ncbi:MAG: hypothetical protein ACRYGG_00840 [Janthinobacterium lividum]
MKIEFDIASKKSKYKKQECPIGSFVQSYETSLKYLVIDTNNWLRLEDGNLKQHLVPTQTLNSSDNWILLPKGTSVTLTSEEGS